MKCQQKNKISPTKLSFC